MSILIPREENRNHLELKEANSLVGFAVNKVLVSDLIESARQQTNRSAFGYNVADQVIARYSAEVAPPVFPVTKFVISSGLRDTSYFIQGSLSRIPHALSFEQALAVFRQPTTINTLALLAMHAPYGLNETSMLVNSPGDSYKPTDDYSTVMPGEGVKPENGGCPVAGDYETMTPKPTPLFRKFVVWSSELALRTFHYPDE